jgi:transposase
MIQLTATFVTGYWFHLCAMTPCAVGYVVLFHYSTGENRAMTITPEQEAQVLRYHHVEKWRIGTIARQLHIHHYAVERVLRREGLPEIGNTQHSIIDSYLPFVRETLTTFPTLTASRLYIMCKERGYTGGPSHFRYLVSHHRPRPVAEAYLRLVTLPGEQAQVDWGHFGHLEIGRARRPLMAFVMVLSWSRRIYLRFFPDAKMENFLRGHVGAFEAFGGLPRILLYDNLKSAVLERQGNAIRFHPTILDFAGHYRYEPRPVAVARGNEKGRVERAIRYIRDAFFAARTFVDLADLNRQAEAWCLGQADDRPCPQDKTMTVREAFVQEQPRLLALPENPYVTDERVAVSVGKTPYVRFDLNDYSVPHTQVRKTLTVVADPERVRILDGSEVVAAHPRSYDKGCQVEELAHIEKLVERKAQAREQRGMSRLTQAVPASSEMLARAAERGEGIGGITSSLLRLVERYGAAEVQAAVLTALARGVPHPHAVRLALEVQRELKDQPPPVSVCMPKHVADRDAVINPHKLDTYDQLTDPKMKTKGEKDE